MVRTLPQDSSRHRGTGYGVRNIPTVLFFKNGELVDRLVGAHIKADYKEKIDAML